MFPHGKLFKPDKEFKLMLLITFFVMFIISPETTHEGLRVPAQSVCVSVWTRSCLCRKKKNLSYEIITGITVSLSLSSTCTIYCQLADRLSACVFTCTAWVGAVMMGFIYFFSVVKRRRKGRREQDQYLPLQLRCTYTNIGSGKINDQNQLPYCRLFCGDKKRKIRAERERLDCSSSAAL